MPVIQSLLDDLKAIADLHKKKNDDYANDSNPFLNFDQCSSVLKWFKDPRDLAFVWPIANKLSRLANLLNSAKTPNNESIDDSLMDIATYVLLWKANLKRRNEELLAIRANAEYKESIQQYRCNVCDKPHSRYTHRLYFQGYHSNDVALCSDECKDKFIGGSNSNYTLTPLSEIPLI